MGQFAHLYWVANGKGKGKGKQGFPYTSNWTPGKGSFNTTQKGSPPPGGRCFACGATDHIKALLNAATLDARAWLPAVRTDLAFLASHCTQFHSMQCPPLAKWASIAASHRSSWPTRPPRQLPRRRRRGQPRRRCFSALAWCDPARSPSA